MSSRAGGLPNPRHSCESVEHYTPPGIIEAARAVLGGIDLDPATSVVANTIVKAPRIFTAAEDGLAHSWAGRIFLNPPGGKTQNESNQKRWYFKLANEWSDGRVDAAIFVCFSVELLQTTQVDSPAGLPLPLDLPFCIPSRRIGYFVERQEQEGGSRLEKGTSPPHASAIILFPPENDYVAALDRFALTFAPIGKVVDAAYRTSPWQSSTLVPQPAATGAANANNNAAPIDMKAMASGAGVPILGS